MQALLPSRCSWARVRAAHSGYGVRRTGHRQIHGSARAQGGLCVQMLSRVLLRRHVAGDALTIGTKPHSAIRGHGDGYDAIVRQSVPCGVVCRGRTVEA